MDFSKYKFSPTSLPGIMSNSKASLSKTGAEKLDKIRAKQIIGKKLTSKEELELPKLIEQLENSNKGSIILSDGCKKTLVGIYIDEVYGKRDKLLSEEVGIGVPHMVRGIKTEPQGLRLLCEIDGMVYFKYKKTVENDYLTGMLDVINAPELSNATKIFDIKSAKDAVSFFGKKDTPFTKANISQMQAYFAITGISEGEIVHCLVGEPSEVIEEQKRLFFNKHCPSGVITERDELAWMDFETSMPYNDIPAKSRLIGLKVLRDEEHISLIYETIEECRNWLQQYHEEHNKFITKRYFE